MSFTIQNVLIPIEHSYEAVDVQIEGDCLSAITSRHLDKVNGTTDGQNKLLLPGFVNAHTHSSEMWQRGLIPPVPLELWIAELYDFAPLDPEQVYLSALGTAVETLLSGGTSVVDHLVLGGVADLLLMVSGFSQVSQFTRLTNISRTLPLVLIPGRELDTITAAVRAYKEVGIRAFIGPLIQDQSLTAGIPDGKAEQRHSPYFRSTIATLELMEEVISQFHQPDEGVNILVAPTGIQLCSDALFEGCIELSNRYNICRHAHLLETKAQKQLAREKYGCSAVEHLQRIGYLGDRTTLAHCVWLSDSDIDILAETQSTVVHNPLSNLRLGSGIAPILKYRQAGVNVTFGCDGAASNDSQDLLEAIKIGSILHNITDLDYHHWITPRQAVEMATLGGAKGLNLAEQLGSLTIGKKADLVLYDLTSLSLLPRTDPIGLLILGRPTQAVHSLWVNGKQIIADGKVTTINVDDLRQQLFERSQWDLNKRQSHTVAQIEAHYRAVMGLVVARESS